jgi:curved DNA-binding protein CbpA
VDRTEVYRVLGLDARSDGDELKAAYRYLSKKYHPDRSADPLGSARFVRVVKAYKTLDLELRKERLINDPVRSTDRIKDDDIFSLGTTATTAIDPELRRSAVRRLGFSGKKAAYVFLRRALSDIDESVAAAAVRSVADLSAFQAAGEIAALWSRASSRLRGAVLDAAEATGEALFRPTLELASHEGGMEALRARRLLASSSSRLTASATVG